MTDFSIVDLSTFLKLCNQIKQDFQKIEPSSEKERRSSINALLKKVEFIITKIPEYWDSIDDEFKTKLSLLAYSALGVLTSYFATVTLSVITAITVISIIGCIFCLLESWLFYYNLKRNLEKRKIEIKRIFGRLKRLTDLYLDKAIGKEGYYAVNKLLLAEITELYELIISDILQAKNHADRCCGLCGILFGYNKLVTDLENARYYSFQIKEKIKQTNEYLENCDPYAYDKIKALQEDTNKQLDKIKKDI